MLNPDFVNLIEEDREDEIETYFDWTHFQKYRYTKAMLQGTLANIDFYPPAINRPNL